MNWRGTWFDFFFFNDTATTEIYTLSLHDALPIFFEGELIAWSAVKGHQADIGGAVAGGYNPNATEEIGRAHV